MAKDYQFTPEELAYIASFGTDLSDSEKGKIIHNILQKRYYRKNKERCKATQERSLAKHFDSAVEKMRGADYE